VWTQESRKGLMSLAATSLLALAVAVLTLKLWDCKLGVPFAYDHDATLTLTWVKTLVDNGWWMTNAYLGAPGRMETHDFPANASLHFAILKGFALVAPDTATIVNVYFVLSFPAVALAALVALRSMGLSRPPAVAGSVLYAFLPYHFWRGEPHLFLAAYYMVPLVLMVVAWIARGDQFLIVAREGGRRGRVELGSGKAVASLLICAAVGLDFPYYPLFACFFLALAGLYTAARGDARALTRGAVLVAVTAASFAVNVLPNVLYHRRNGPNPSPQHITYRPWQDGEVYGLTVTQMLLPAPNHRVPALARLRDKFYAGTPLTSEGDAMALGTIGSIGFLLSVGCLLACQRHASGPGRLCHAFGLLSVLAVLLCTAGGFATMFNLVGITIMRTYNRVSIFLAFAAIATFFVAVDALAARYASRGWPRALASCGLAALLVLGLLDQTAQTYIPPYEAVAKEYQSDGEFVARIEAAVPVGTMIFQLPYVAYGSYANASHQMVPYCHMRGYLHSHALRWSFGAMHGRPDDALHARIASLPLEDGLRDLAYVGFGGVYVDRLGYADHGAEVEGRLRRALGSEPLVSGNGRFSFFAMGDYVDRLRSQMRDEEWALRRDLVLHEPRLTWGSGFYPEESSPSDRWRSCATRGRLEVYNPSDRPRLVSLSFAATTYSPGAARLVLRGPGFADGIAVDPAGKPYTRVIEVPPGRHAIRFTCTAKPVVLSAERTLVFALHSPRLAEVAPEVAQRPAGASASESGVRR
jgi:phosphoglycerol transferase